MKDSTEKIAEQLFHDIEDIIDKHIKGYRDEKIVEGCYYTESFMPLAKHVEAMVIKARIEEVKDHDCGCSICEDRLNIYYKQLKQLEAKP